MRNKIIGLSIQCLKEQGLKFSIDNIAKELGISKKTIYKMFPDKESLATAVYQTYFEDCISKAEIIIENKSDTIKHDLISLYLDSFTMINKDLFNKFKLNESISKYATESQLHFWSIIEQSLGIHNSLVNKAIIDGSFEKSLSLKFDEEKNSELIERILRILC